MTIMMSDMAKLVRRRGASKSTPFYTSGFSLSAGSSAGVVV